MKTLVLASALLLLPAMARAQQPADQRWAPWIGCWELVLENARDAATRPSPSRRALPSTSPSRPQICIEPSGVGVTLTTRVAGQQAIQQTIVADGLEHPITDAECRGIQRAEWSGDSRKIYSRADLTCSNDKGNRRVSGFSILGSNGTWTDIQAIDVSGQQTVRVRSYRRASEVGQIGTGLRHATPLTLDDVKDASGKVSPRALEAALVETGSSYDLSGKDLLALQDADVPASVTDLIVALSYPDRFVVERQARADVAPATPFIDEPFFLGWAFGYPMWSDLYGFYSPLYGPYAPYFYSPFYAYLPWYYPPYYGGGGGVIIIDPDNGSGGGGQQPSGGGRAVDGRGYTRVRPREADPAPTPINASRGSMGSSSGASSSSSGGGATVSSQGFSSGGSSGGGGTSGGGGDSGGGRTAQPR
jgi:hypothetical protein